MSTCAGGGRYKHFCPIQPNISAMLRLVPFAAQAPRPAPSLLWRALSTAPTPAVIHKQFTEKLQSAREKAMLGGGQDRVDKQVCLCVCVSVCHVPRVCVPAQCWHCSLPAPSVKSRPVRGTRPRVAVWRCGGDACVGSRCGGSSVPPRWAVPFHHLCRLCSGASVCLCGMEGAPALTAAVCAVSPPHTRTHTPFLLRLAIFGFVSVCGPFRQPQPAPVGIVPSTPRRVFGVQREGPCCLPFDFFFCFFLFMLLLMLTLVSCSTPKAS